MAEIKDRIYYPIKGGFIRVEDVMGDDSSIVRAARISYGKGTKKVSQDRGLIRYLMRHQHLTPFEMCEIKFHIRAPMDTWRQWIRHRTANVNEYSTRYSEAIDACYETDPKEWRMQSSKNKQGSEFYFGEREGSYFSEQEKDFHKIAKNIYNERLKKGMAREQARKDLPLSNFTEAYWKIDLRNLLNFINLRSDKHAQLEIRNYAIAMGNIVSEWCPMAYEAFLDYVVNTTTFSIKEMNILRQIISGSPNWTYLEYLNKREKEEFFEKIKPLEIKKPHEKNETRPEELIAYLL